MARTGNTYLGIKTWEKSLSVGMVHEVVVHHKVKDHLLVWVPFIGIGVEDYSVVLAVGRYLINIVVLVKRCVNLMVNWGTSLHVLQEQGSWQFQLVGPLEGRPRELSHRVHELLKVCEDVWAWSVEPSAYSSACLEIGVVFVFDEGCQGVEALVLDFGILKISSRRFFLRTFISLFSLPWTTLWHKSRIRIRAISKIFILTVSTLLMLADF